MSWRETKPYLWRIAPKAPRLLKTTHRVKDPDEELSSPDCISQRSSIQTVFPNNSLKTLFDHHGILGSDQSEISPLLCTLPNRMSMTLWLQYYSNCTYTYKTTQRQSVRCRLHVRDIQLQCSHMYRFRFRKYHNFLTYWKVVSLHPSSYPLRAPSSEDSHFAQSSHHTGDGWCLILHWIVDGETTSH